MCFRSSIWLIHKDFSSLNKAYQLLWESHFIARALSAKLLHERDKLTISFTRWQHVRNNDNEHNEKDNINRIA